MIVELDLFSGRPNPSWELRPDQVQELLGFLSGLPLKPGEPADHGLLGYRGLILRAGQDFPRILVGCGEVVQEGRDGSLVYEDTGSKLEKWLLDQAEGQIEPGLLRSIREEL